MLVASDALVAGEVRMVRLESALGPCVQGLHEKREKVPHPGLQHVHRVDLAVKVAHFGPYFVKAGPGLEWRLNW